MKHKFAANDIALLPNASGAPPQMPIRHKAKAQSVSDSIHRVRASPDSTKILHKSELYALETLEVTPQNNQVKTWFGVTKSTSAQLH